MSGRTYSVFDCPVLADEAAVRARMAELESIFNGPIPEYMKPMTVAAARHLADARVRHARKDFRESLRSARGWLLKGNREMSASNRLTARHQLEHYRALRVWRGRYMASLSAGAKQVAA